MIAFPNISYNDVKQTKPPYSFFSLFTYCIHGSGLDEKAPLEKILKIEKLKNFLWVVDHFCSSDAKDLFCRTLLFEGEYCLENLIRVCHEHHISKPTFDFKASKMNILDLLVDYRQFLTTRDESLLVDIKKRAKDLSSSTSGPLYSYVNGFSRYVNGAGHGFGMLLAGMTYGAAYATGFYDTSHKEFNDEMSAVENFFHVAFQKVLKENK